MSVPMQLQWEGGQRYRATDSYGRAVHIDGDVSATAGAKPSDLMPISLAACVAYTVLEVLHKQRQDVQGLSCSIEVDNDPDPPWAFTRIAVAFTVEGSVDQAKADKALRLAHEKYCSVSASLRPETAVEYVIQVAPG